MFDFMFDIVLESCLVSGLCVLICLVEFWVGWFLCFYWLGGLLFVGVLVVRFFFVGWFCDCVGGLRSLSFVWCRGLFLCVGCVLEGWLLFCV